jgi:spermidine synthase
MWGSMLPRYDGDPASLTRYDDTDRALPFALLPPHPRVAIIGAAGGNEILASLHFDAAHVTAVELNPVTVSLLTTHFRNFTGRVAENPRVTLLNAEGRAFLGSTANRYDLVWFVAPDSYAAMNAATSGAYVLSESYLYTAEMIEDSLAHLTPGGIICVQFGETDFEHKPNRTTRYLTTAREAFRRLGIDDFPRHVLVGTNPSFAFTIATILLKATPFTEAEARGFVRASARVTGATTRFAWTETAADHPVVQAITLAPDALERWYTTYPFDVRTVNDDAPFFWHFVPFGQVLRSPWPASALGWTEQGTGERLLLVLLAVATLFAALFLLAPLLARRALWRAVPYKGRAAVYFAALGLGFMFLEVTLIQRLTLFLGYPTYSLTVTLFALLVSTGAGSLASERAARRRDRALGVLGAVLTGLVLFYLFGLGPLCARAFGAPFAWRVLLAVAVLLPLGLCLGAFMPLGLRTVAALTPHAGEYVAWAWAVNGFFSVVSSVLATLLSMTFGFSAVLVAALAVYAVGIAALRGIPAAAR